MVSWTEGPGRPWRIRRERDVQRVEISLSIIGEMLLRPYIEALVGPYILYQSGSSGIEDYKKL
jgi:hypothetical protein